MWSVYLCSFTFLPVGPISPGVPGLPGNPAFPCFKRLSVLLKELPYCAHADF